ncbi:hypothetical protein LXJ58_33555, partial [Escherichia coli]|nr:hypothetical protein [Escherichia coli]
ILPQPHAPAQRCGQTHASPGDSNILGYLDRKTRLIVRRTIKKLPFTRLCTGAGPLHLPPILPMPLHDSAPMLHQRQIKSIGC